MSKLSVALVDQEIGKRIQLRRKEVGLTAAELSEKIGVSQQQLSRYERGTNKINVAHLVNLAVCLDTPISWFFIECESDDTLQKPEIRNQYVSVRDEDLKVRLEQHWAKLTYDQRRAFIILLDNLTP